ncbi:serine hydrolase domain-containing protein [Gaiella sp.]|uniref:serine hydrolase domain-containing protein n=1 Tax=Gaiella sp. TaxID=2663207 RepID=UPI002E342016|nr:serine hydrolase domain-containing protein [Gaiella sp.]HEX5582257.1 serine hydrolase domain-containing protein [Gaiella sp.]
MIEELKGRFEQLRVQWGVPGMSWALVNGGEIAQTGALGFQTAPASRPVSNQTRFQACSISKPIAALAMLRLVDRGLLDLDADVNDSLTSWRLPANAEWQPIVTLRHLVSHSAGLTTSGFPGYKRSAQLPSAVEILTGVFPANTFAVRVDTIPGVQFRYSGGGTLALQQLLEDVTRTPFPALMQELVLDPLGMTDSDYTQPPPERVHDLLASGHDEFGGPVDGGWHVYPEMATAGLWTTPTDLCRYALAVQTAFAGGRGALLSQPLAREMLTPQVTASGGIGGLNAVGLGPFVTQDGVPPRFGHSGGNEGFRCHLLAYREDGIGAAVMTNSDAGGWLLQHAFAAIVEACAWPGDLEEIVEPDWPATATLVACAGAYRVREEFDFTITPAGHGLEAAFAGQAPIVFAYTGRTDAGAIEFASTVTATVLRLESEEQPGQAITFVQNDQAIVCPRVQIGDL